MQLVHDSIQVTGISELLNWFENTLHTLNLWQSIEETLNISLYFQYSLFIQHFHARCPANTQDRVDSAPQTVRALLHRIATCVCVCVGVCILTSSAMKSLVGSQWHCWAKNQLQTQFSQKSSDWVKLNHPSACYTEHHPTRCAPEQQQ